MYQVSILIPIYKVEEYIERCVRSLMEQTYDNIQYVFVDDFSPDNSCRILEKVIHDYPQRVPNVLIIKHEHNRGLSAARNTAVSNATGFFILHVDSDDYVERDAVEQLVKTQVETDAEIVTGLTLIEYKKYKEVLELREYPSVRDMTIDVIKPTIRHTIWGRLIKSSLYQDYCIRAKEGTNVGEDAQVMPRLSYYAKNVTNCYHLTYHYNCENENSYVHQTDDVSKLCRRGIQDVDSYLVLRDFFKDKDREFYNEAEKCISTFCQLLMENYIRSSNKNGFDKIKKIYKGLECGRVLVAPWQLLHSLTCYNYWYCKISHIILSPIIRIIR